MAKKITRPKRPAAKRSASELSLVDRKREITRVRNLNRQISTLSRDLRRAVARANSDLYSLAKMVFDSDTNFRDALIGLKTSATEPDDRALYDMCLCGHNRSRHDGNRDACSACSCELFELDDARAPQAALAGAGADPRD